ncbi:hypothetical protein QJQ45_023443, partial [Haematococcus lacustris]
GSRLAMNPPKPSTVHILLVDDERLSRVVVANLLRKCSYKVMSASEQAEMMYTCIRGGAEEYLIKPVTQKEVQNIWTHVIKRLSLAMDAATQRALEEAASCEEQAQAQAGQAQPLDHYLFPMTSQAEVLQGSGVQVAVALSLERQRGRGPAGLQHPLPATVQLPTNLLNHHPWTQQLAEERGGGGESPAGEEEVGRRMYVPHDVHAAQCTMPWLCHLLPLQVLLLSRPPKAGTDPLPSLPRVRPSSFTLHPNGNVTLKPPQPKCDHAWKPMRTTSPGLPAPPPALPSPPLTLAHPGAGHSQRRSAPGLPASLRMNGPDLISHGAQLSGSLKHDVMTLRRQHTQVQQDAQALLFEFMRGRHTPAPAAAAEPAPAATAAPDPLAPGVGDLVGQRVDATGEVAGRGDLGGAGAATAAAQQAGSGGKVFAEAANATDEPVGKAATAAVAASGAASGAAVSSPGAGTGRAGLPCWQQGQQGQGVGGSVSGAAAGWVGVGVSGEDEACYASPEERTGAVPSTASIMYSLGVLMFDLLYQVWSDMCDLLS